MKKLLIGTGLTTAFVAAIITAGFVYVINPTDDFSETPESVIKLVLDAVELYDMHGEGAFSRLDADPEFIGQELYVYAIRDSDGIIVADGRDKGLIGKNIDDIKDINGMEIGKMIHEKATKDGTWVEYLWKDPANNQILPKQSWILKHDGYIFGSGIYYQEI